jgi:hypothetical protein
LIPIRVRDIGAGITLDGYGFGWTEDYAAMTVDTVLVSAADLVVL